VGGAVTQKLDLVPWTRRGGPAKNLVDGRPVTSVDFDLFDMAHSHAVSLEFAQPGPDDVEGLVAGAVGQLVPPSGDGDAEEVHCPYVEFTTEDLPWRYGFSDAGGHPLPWCVVVAGVPDQIEVQGEHAVLGVGVQQTHPLANARLWAHVQRPRGGPVGSGLSRVLSFAPLDPETDYVAALVVPWVNGGPAWTGAAPVTVRCLRSWRFRTGEAGTFETLAAELHPADNDPVGTVTVTLPTGETVRVPGALTSIEFEIEPLGDDDPARDHDVLVDETDPTGRRRVQPPAYGAPWVTHAAVVQDVEDARFQDPRQWPWTAQANADLRMRVIAGVGLQAGIDLQEQIVDSAARQWGTGRWTHELVSALSLGLAASGGLWNRRLPTTDTERLSVLGPAAHRLPVEDTPAAATLAGALLRPGPGAASFPVGLLGPRLTRSVGAGRVHEAGGAQGLLTQAAEGLPVSEQPRDDIAAGGSPFEQDAGHLDTLGALTEVTTGGAVTADQVDAALTNAARQLEFPVVLEQPEHPPLDRPQLPAVSDLLVKALASFGVESSAGRRVIGRLHGIDPAEPLAAPQDCPNLDMPVWPYVRDVVPHWLLPGSESLGQGEVVAMRTCPEFIEAFLLGLNQRALGELQWRQHPLRVGCTPLRRFWDHLPPGPGGRGDDIAGVRGWAHNSPLGTHAPAGIRAEKLVVVVRSPLFRRYPRTLLFLAPNSTSPPVWTRGRVDLTTPVMPQFVAAMGPDLTLFAFDVDPDVVQTHWVVVQEMPEGIRFVRTSPVVTHAGAWAAANLDTPLRVLLPGPDTVGVPGGGP
jgi:hypothetical protein